MNTHASIAGRLVTNGAVALTVDGLQEQRETGSQKTQPYQRAFQIVVRFFYSGGHHELVSGGLNT